MEQNKAEWLPHLSSDIVADARGRNLDAYLIALEGWRRGLTLKWHMKESEKFSEMKTWFVDKPGKLFSLSSKDKTHYFFRSRGDKVTNEAVEIGADKERTKHFLAKRSINIPEGKRFCENETNKSIINYFSSLGFPVVLKPTDGSFGRGVVTNIQDIATLESALDHVRSGLKYRDIIIERYVAGSEYRIYVVGDKAVGALRREPANVIGDGINTIAALVANKNEKRRMNPRLISCPIDIEQENIDFLIRSGYQLKSIPEKGVQVFFSEKSNISLGGDPIDVLDELSNEIKNTAIQAIHAIPGLAHGAVDLIIDASMYQKEEAVILEINPTAQIGSLVFPLKGKSRDIPAAIINSYFPETIGIDSYKSKIYFNYKEVLSPLINRTAVVAKTTDIPLGKLYGKRYIVSGSVKELSYHIWLREEALKQDLIGYINKRENEDIEILVVGTDKEAVENYEQVIKMNKDKAVVEQVKGEEWDNPIKLGFEIQGGCNNLVNELQRINIKLVEADKRRKKLEHEHEQLQNSRAWRLTAPIRSATGGMKTIYRSLLKGRA